MHELSIMTSVLDIVISHAQKNGARRVQKVNMQIGIMSDIIPEWAQTYFDMLSKDTIASEAILDIERIPVKIRCRECGHEFGFKDREWKFSCEKCESSDIELLSGREFMVSSIEIE